MSDANDFRKISRDARAFLAQFRSLISFAQVAVDYDFTLDQIETAKLQLEKVTADAARIKAENLKAMDDAKAALEEVKRRRVEISGKITTMEQDAAKEREKLLDAAKADAKALLDAATKPREAAIAKLEETINIRKMALGEVSDKLNEAHVEHDKVREAIAELKGRFN